MQMGVNDRSAGAHSEAAYVVWTLDTSITREAIPGIRDDLRACLQDSPAEVVICDVGAFTQPDLVIIEAMASLRLTAGRLHRRLLFRGPSDRLRMLLELTGLHDLLLHPDHRLGPAPRPDPEK
jgi:anti-anti-sigma regulatory factor